MRTMLIGLILLLAACDAPAPPTAMAAGPLPKQVCKKVSDGLTQMSATAMFEYNSAGEATMAEEVWLPMSPPQRDQLAQLLAFHAACQQENAPAEQKVVIRSETGRPLLDRVVETQADISSLIAE